MAAEDEKRGRELARLAQEFMLWLQKNELPEVSGLKGAPITHFEFYAGIYRKLHRPLLPSIGSVDQAELRRFQELKLSVSYVLLITDPNEPLVNLPNGRQFQHNRIVQVDSAPLGQGGFLMTVGPKLDSMEVNDTTLRLVECHDFSTIRNRLDLVYDDAATAAQYLGFRYKFIFNYDIPRKDYEVNVENILVPTGLDPGPVNNGIQILAERIREFRDYLRLAATYKNRSGEYYEKWRSVDSSKRQFRPTQLTDTYLKECFKEYIMKQGDNVLILDLIDRLVLYRLLWKKPKRTAASPKLFTVQHLLTIRHAQADAPRQEHQDDDDVGDSQLQFPIRGVFFHVLEGASHLPVLALKDIHYKSNTTKRFLVDYRAFVHYHYDDLKLKRLKFATNRDWFDQFVEVYFGEQSYEVDLTLSLKPFFKIDREALFLRELRAQADMAVGPIATRLKKLVERCDNVPDLYYFYQGLQLESTTGVREFIGISDDWVYEWHPDTETVTRIRLNDWLREFRMLQFTKKVYNSTQGVIPLGIMVFAAGLIGLTGGAAAAAGFTPSLGWVARTGVSELLKDQAEQYISKKLERKFRTQLIALVVDYAMSLMPWKDNAYFELVRGFFEGFGGGAVQHYLSEIDDRLERQIREIKKYALNIVTKGGYRAYILYDKISNAYIKINALANAIKAVWFDELPKLAAQQLSRFGEYLGVAFLIILFVVIYIDYVFTSELRRDKKKLDTWVKKQKEALVFIVRETGDEVKNYAIKLQEDIRGLSPDARINRASELASQYEEALSRSIKDKLVPGVSTVVAVADYLKLLLNEMGIENWDELKSLSFAELMTRGFEILDTPGFKVDAARKLGSAFGELVGTIMLERQIVPERIRKTGGIFGSPTSKLARGALEGGTWRALWTFAIYPFEHLHDLPSSLKRGLDEASGRKQNPFSRSQHRNTSYRDFVRDLMGDEEELARRLIRLAEDEDLSSKISTLVESAKMNKVPPSLEELRQGDNYEWPSDAIIFILYS